VSDRLSSAFGSLRGQRPPVPFARPEAIRRRGRQRTVRQAVAAGFAVLVVLAGTVGLATAVLYRGSGPTYPPAGTPTVTTPPPAPSPSLVPSPTGSGGLATASPVDLASLLLRPAELGPGSWQVSPPYEPFDSADLWYWAGVCAAYRSGDYPSLRRMEQVETTGFRKGEQYVHQHLTRYAAGWGLHAIEDTRLVLRTCAGTASPRPTPPVPPYLRTVETGFAGDEAVLVLETSFAFGAESQPLTPISRLIAVVRVGDLLTLLAFAPGMDKAYARDLAAKAAGHLR
jgi:hypothetical protein